MKPSQTKAELIKGHFQERSVLHFEKPVRMIEGQKSAAQGNNLDCMTLKCYSDHA